jgi:PAS domain S-box-containing protein
MPPPNLRRDEILAWLSMLGIFSTSAWLGPTYAIESLYVGPILLAIRVPRPRLALELATVATLVLVGHPLLFNTTETPWQQLVAGHLAMAAAVWLTAVVVAADRRTLQRQRRLENIRNALDQAAIVSTTNVDGEITYANAKFCENSGFSLEELLGQNHSIVNSGLHPPEFFKEMYAAITAGKVWRGEIRNRAKQGHLYWVDTTIVPFLDEAGRPYEYIDIRHDITERMQSEAALREQTALARVGKLAAVVAHEVRNPLAGIRGAIQVIGKRLPPDRSEQRVIKEIITRIDTLNAIVEDLLVFARPKDPVLATIPAAALVRDTVSLLRDDPRFAHIELRVESADARVVADGEQIKLVLLNLLLNAAQAMGGRGTVEIASRPTADGHELRVTDHGPGIPDEVRERLFEPFFTTKSQGTGLGLATARRILESHGGSISLESSPSGGVTAVVRLPSP